MKQPLEVIEFDKIACSPYDIQSYKKIGKGL